MANDKRDDAVNHAARMIIRTATQGNRTKIYQQLYDEAYDAGHAAATAEGIPQADGWVDVADRLPAQSDLSGYLNDSVFTWSAVGGDDGWASVGRFDIERQKFIGDGYVIAWMPIPPYQRQSREGDSK